MQFLKETTDTHEITDSSLINILLNQRSQTQNYTYSKILLI